MPTEERVFPPRGAGYWLAGALALVSALAAAFTFLVPGILTGPAAMNGSARGTALVVFLLAVPALVAAMWSTGHGSARGVIVWLGAFAIYVWAVVTLNLVAWLSAIVPALFAKTPADLLAGTGLSTNPVYVQDLAFWLLLMTVAGVWLWRRHIWGYLVAGSVLTLWVIESIGVAMDQWFGHRADPASTVASGSMVWVFAALAAIGCVPLAIFFRHMIGHQPKEA